MSVKKLVGVMGSGLIGTDPYDASSWSGSSRHFFNECNAQGVLHRAFGVDANRASRLALMLRNYSPNRERWRGKFYLDTNYYDLLSREIANAFVPTDKSCDVLQIGGIYRLRPVLELHQRLFSYHDANLAQAMRSPYFPRWLPEKRVARALAYERSVYESVDMIFAMSDFLRRTFIDCLGVEPNRVRTIGAGINLDTFPDVPSGKPYDTKRVLFIGTNFRRKGGMELLRAFRIVRNAHATAELYIVGPRQLSIPGDLSSGVVHVGHLSKSDPAQLRQLTRILLTSSLFVMPSLYEPFGIAPLEAMAHALPAVLTDDWAFPEMVRPGVNGELVKAGDVAVLADTLIELLRDANRLREMGNAGRAIVAERFTWPSVVRRLRTELSTAPDYKTPV